MWVDLSSFNKPGVTEVSQKAFLDKLPDDNEITINIKDFYIKLKLTLKQPIVPLVTEPTLTQKDLLPLLDLEKKLSKE